MRRLRVEWTRSALRDLEQAQDYIAQDNPTAAREIAQRVADAAKGLTDHPKLGRDGHVSGTRERPVDRTPYLIVYRIRGQVIEILRLWHGRQDWQAPPF